MRTTVPPRLIKLAKAIMPSRAFLGLRERHHAFMLQTAMNQLSLVLATREHVPGDLIQRLVYGWDNEAWSASEDLMAEVLRRTRSASGPILECGCGLTTMLGGIAAGLRRQAYLALEQDKGWCDEIGLRLQKYDVTNVSIRHAPLVPYDNGKYWWYTVDARTIPHDISLVVCDGPPSGTPGGRFGLMPVLSGHLAAGCVILLDDVHRGSELAVLEKWKAEYGVTYRIEAGERPFAVATTPAL